MQEQMDPSQLSDDYGDTGRSELSKQMASLYATGFAYSRIGDLKYASSHGIRYRGLPLGLRNIMGGPNDISRSRIPYAHSFGLTALGYAFGGPTGAAAGFAVGTFWRSGLLDAIGNDRNRSIRIAHGFDPDISNAAKMYIHPTEFTLPPKYKEKITKPYHDAYNNAPDKMFIENIDKVKSQWITSGPDTPTYVAKTESAGRGGIYTPTDRNTGYSFKNALKSAISRRTTIPLKHEYYKSVLMPTIRNQASDQSNIIMSSIRRTRSNSAVSMKYSRLAGAFGASEVMAKELGRFSVWNTMDNQHGIFKNLRFAFGRKPYKEAVKNLTSEIDAYHQQRFSGYDQLLNLDAPRQPLKNGQRKMVQSRAERRLGVRFYRAEKRVKKEAADAAKKAEKEAAAQEAKKTASEQTKQSKTATEQIKQPEVTQKVRHDTYKRKDRARNLKKRMTKHRSMLEKATAGASGKDIKDIATAIEAIRDLTNGSFDVSGFEKELDMILKDVAKGATSVPDSVKILKNNLATAVKEHGITEAAFRERAVAKGVTNLKSLRMSHLSSIGARVTSGALAATTLVELGSAAFVGMYKLGQSVSMTLDKWKGADFGSGMALQTQQATTERSRAIQSIHTNRMNASSYLGREAQQFS